MWSWFCSVFIKKLNLCYVNFLWVMLEKCELWENCWDGVNVSGVSFVGLDLFGG